MPGAKRPLDGQPYPFVFFDALQIKVGRQGAVRATTVILGVGVGAGGQREFLELHLAYGETEGGWHRCQAHFRQNVIDQTPPPLRER